MDTVVKSDGKTLKPNQDIRRCSFQSGGGLVTVNFIGASKKKPKLPTNSTKSPSSPKKYNRYKQQLNSKILYFCS